MYLLAILIILFVGAAGLLEKHKEKIAWNNGFSKKSGKKWVHYSTDSLGNRGYKDFAGNYIWISYNVDK